MKVFIENEAGSNKKNLFDERTLAYKKTVEVSRPYPYPYGFVIGTTSGDGDNLDCFVLTNRPLKSGETVEVEPIGMFEQVEDGQEDPKILAGFSDERMLVDENVRKNLQEFISHVFEHLPNKKVKVGNFLGLDQANDLIKRFTDI